MSLSYLMTQLAIDKTDFTKLGNLRNLGSKKHSLTVFFICEVLEGRKSEVMTLH